MRTHLLGRHLRVLLGAMAFGATGLGAQGNQGGITVRVTADGQPLDQAQVIVIGTNLGGLTSPQGTFTIRNAPAGAHVVRVIRVGYSEQKKPVTVTAGQVATVEFALTEVAISLSPVVTTATGETRRVEMGNSIGQISASELTKSAPVSTVSDLLNSRTPGVAITTGTQTGSGSRTRIRGQSSLTLSNEPIYIIDGIRMTSNLGEGFGTGGVRSSRVGDINPEEIENIEVVKGPSAATLYGTDAANGVIVITTKKGRAGSARWSVYGEGGTLWDQNTYPTNYTIAGRSPGTTAYRECSLPQVSFGTCLKDSVRVFNLWEDPETTPLGTGYRSQAGMQLQGGTDIIRYFLAGEREDETGLLQLPQFERTRFDSTGTPIRDWTDRPNKFGKNNFRMNLNSTVNPKLDLGLQTAFVDLNQRYTLESNATAGLGSQAFGGPGYKTNGVIAGVGTPLFGYRAWTPGYTWQEKTGQQVRRSIVSLNANWRPTSWWQNRVSVGNDYNARTDANLLLRGEGPPLTAIYRNGFARDLRTNTRNTTVDIASTASYNPKTWISTKTSAGVQYINFGLDQATASGIELAPGSQTAGAGATLAATQATTLTKTLGVYVEEVIGLNDRLFITGALRSDQNSAFGTDFQNVIYPKLSASWILSDESFFPQMGWLNQLRLRSSFGSSGVQPGPNDAIRFFGFGNFNLRGADFAAVTYSAIGNNDLRPERSTEIEGGFETKMFNQRASLDVTYYRRETSDALIGAIVPPSFGGPVRQRANLGATLNWGWEGILTAQLLDKKAFALDMTLNASTNANKVLSLGNTPPQIGVSTRIVEGSPLFAFWQRPITGWQDKNGDKILTYNSDPNLNEVFVGDSAIFRGYTQPRHIVNLTTGIDLFNRRLRLQSLVDWRGGNLWYNNTERIRCVSRQNCNGLMNPNSSFEEQAMVVATRDHPSRTLDGFFQPGAFLRFREFAATYTASTRIANLLRARSLSITATGRNLWRWTDYRGVDPENDYQATDDVDTPSDFQTVGPASNFIFRVNIGY